MTDESATTLPPPAATDAAAAQAQALQRQAIQWMQLANQLPGGRLYANGFVVALTGSDVVVTLMINGMPCGLLNISFIGTKSLIEELTKAVTDIEKAMGHEIESMQTIVEGIQRVRGSGANL